MALTLTSTVALTLTSTVALTLTLTIQANRFYMSDTRDIKVDPCDNRIIRCHNFFPVATPIPTPTPIPNRTRTRCNNCLQCLACLFELAACLTGDDGVGDAACAIRC